MKILVVDVGGTHVKILATGQKQKREFVSGPKMTALRMVADVKKLPKDWAYDVVSIGFPGPVLHGRPVAEPHNLGCGWTGFNFASAFGLPVRVANDAAMQALGSYRGRKDAVPGIGNWTRLGDDRQRHRRTDGTRPFALQERHIRRLRWRPRPRSRRQKALAKARRGYDRTIGRGHRTRGCGHRRWKSRAPEEAAEGMPGWQQCLCLHRRIPYVGQRVRTKQPRP